MEKLRTSLTIIRHSLEVMRRHPMLLVFPFISLAVALAVYVFFLAPLMFDTTLAEIWYRLRLPDESWDVIAPWRAERETVGRLWQLHFLGYAAYYLIAMFVMTFCNVALYSQIIAGMNGGRVSVPRGFGVACAKLPAIFAWSIMAGAVGAILRALQERLGFPGKWVAGLAGLSWSAASVFVIPVIINEPQRKSPLEYVRISTALLRRVWGEGVAGIGSLTLVFVLFFVALMVVSINARSLSGAHAMQVTALMTICSVFVVMVLYLAWQIFECGLYVYATEGVAPGTFSEEVFDRVWALGSGAEAGANADAGPIVSRSLNLRWLRFLLPAAIAGASIWFHFSPWQPPQSEPGVSSVRIDLADLEYRLGVDDLRAAGLFAEGKKPGRSLFVEGTINKFFTGRSDAGLHPELAKFKGELWVHFYGKDVAAGKERVRRSVEILKMRFPGHADAIVLNPVIPYTPRTTVITWPAVRGATSYSLEIDCFHCCGTGQWCTDIGSKWKTVTNLTSTTYTFDWVGAQPGRVRIWGVSANGRRGLKSAWTQFDYKW